ncbi:MAG: hypothetical protein K9L02_07270 [Acholeplasmataceae bacterium]|nr:hypothetical protein [Acholeplasmataceae bacterium]
MKYNEKTPGRYQLTSFISSSWLLNRLLITIELIRIPMNMTTNKIGMYIKYKYT